MDRENDRRDDDLIDLGAVTDETRGLVINPAVDSQGTFGGGGLSDD